MTCVKTADLHDLSVVFREVRLENSRGTGIVDGLVSGLSCTVEVLHAPELFL